MKGEKETNEVSISSLPRKTIKNVNLHLNKIRNKSIIKNRYPNVNKIVTFLPLLNYFCIPQTASFQSQIFHFHSMNGTIIDYVSS